MSLEEEMDAGSVGRLHASDLGYDRWLAMFRKGYELEWWTMIRRAVGRL